MSQGNNTSNPATRSDALRGPRRFGVARLAGERRFGVGRFFAITPAP